jgi:hypothetical protein
MFGGKVAPQQKLLSPYEKRAKEREAEYARLGLASFEDQQRHEGRKVMLGEGYHQRNTGTWKEAEECMRKSGHKKWWDFWS